jgi:hypothetical protein
MQTLRFSRILAMALTAACAAGGCAAPGRQLLPNPAAETATMPAMIVDPHNAIARILTNPDGRTALVTGGWAAASSTDPALTTRLAPDTGPPYVYVGNSQYETTQPQQADDIVVYGDKGSSPVRIYPRIAKHWPGAFAFDGSGNLYAAYYSVFSPTDNGLVVEYAAGTTRKIRTISQGIYIPNAVAVDASDNIYAANDAPEDFGSTWPSRGAPGTVSVYAPGISEQPSRTIRLGDEDADALVFDGSGNLFVASEVPKVFRSTGCGPCGGPGSVTAYAPSRVKPFLSIHSVYPTPYALAIDAFDDVYVCNDVSPFTTTVYSRQGSQLRTLDNAFEPIAFSATLDAVYVASTGTRSEPKAIDVYRVGHSKPYRRLHRGIGEYLTALATDPRGHLYSLNLGESSITEFAPDGSPLRKLTQGLAHPYALAISDQ